MGQFTSTGIINQINSTTLEIKELPIGRWTEDMKKVLSTLVSNNTIKGYREHHTEENVHFVINMTRNKLNDMSSNFENLFKLEEKMNTTNMHLFNKNNIMQKYDNVEDIMNEFYPIRLNMYEKRKLHQLNTMKYKLKKINNKCNFLTMVSDGTINLVNRNKMDLENDLLNLNFTPEDHFTSDDGDILENVGHSSNNKESKFDYLLRTPLSSITMENVESAKNEALHLMEMKNKLENTKSVELWLNDLHELKKKLLKDKSYNTNRKGKGNGIVKRGGVKTRSRGVTGKKTTKKKNPKKN